MPIKFLLFMHVRGGGGGWGLLERGGGSAIYFYGRGDLLHLMVRGFCPECRSRRPGYRSSMNEP